MTEIQRLAKIMVLKDMRKEYELRAKYNGGVDYDCYRALDMAIEELEQEPCTDAIRRQEMRLIDANALKKDLTRFYDNEVTAKQLIDEQPTIRQDPCGDAISRQAVLEKIHEAPYINDCSNIGMLLEAWINSIPSVKPQYTDAEIQKMQELEFAEIQKAYEIGKEEGSSEKPNKWIPVSERLPEDHKDVLICLSSDQICIGCYNSHKLPFSNNAIGWGASYTHNWCSNNVIAWMPLPERYKASPTGVESEDKE